MEAVEEGPSGRGAGPGEVCPACGTSLETTVEAETQTEPVKARLSRGSNSRRHRVSCM